MDKGVEIQIEIEKNKVDDANFEAAIGVAAPEIAALVAKVDASGETLTLTGGQPCIQWGNRILYDSLVHASLNWETRTLGVGDWTANAGSFKGAHKSSDGSSGATNTYTFDATVPGSVTGITVKDGLIISVTTL